MQAAESADAADVTREMPLAEKVVATIGAFIVFAVLTFLAVDAITGDRSPPDIHVAVEAIEQVRYGYLVRVRAINDGGKSAARVELQAVVTTPGGGQETARMTLDYLAGHSEAEGGMMFDTDPRGRPMRLRALGYSRP